MDFVSATQADCAVMMIEADIRSGKAVTPGYSIRDRIGRIDNGKTLPESFSGEEGAVIFFEDGLECLAIQGGEWVAMSIETAQILGVVN
jgi:hypothetical protein